VSFAIMLWLVPVAAYGLTSLLLSIMVAVAWRAGLDRMCFRSTDLLALRLMPAAGAALFTSTVILPAFIIYEPDHHREQVGPFVIVLVLLVLITVSAGLVRGGRAGLAVRRLLRKGGRDDIRCMWEGRTVDLIDIREPIVAVVGVWRPRIVAAKHVFGACSREEFLQVIAHESAHVATRDNFKLLLLLISPDVLAWLPAGATLAARWRAAAELEADQRAAGSDPGERVVLASALIKVARLSSGNGHQVPVLGMHVVVDDIEGRVRQLLAPAQSRARATLTWILILCASLVPIVAVPYYGHVHQFVEALVWFGR
jgi:Zn-dependent protease with chaperone function